MSTRLLIVTVGGAPEPIVASLLHWRPVRTVFVVTRQTRDSVAGDILPKVQESGWQDFDEGRYDLHEITDHQDYSGAVNELRSLDSRVESWVRDHPSSEIIADFTGGTKAMSAALALIAGRWPCHISYVGGTERTKHGVGVVVSGREQILHAQNPADALGLVVLDIALALLRNHAYAAAHTTLQGSLQRISEPTRKAELGAVTIYAGALVDWDRFQHKDALNKLRDLPKHHHNLEAAVGPIRAREILGTAKRLQAHLEAVVEAGAGRPSRALILDLLANARRRLDEQRWDDATARLYRAIEATAQFHLANNGIPHTSKVPLESIPEPLRSKVASTATNGLVKLGLQDAWLLLQLLEPAKAQPFFTAGLDKPESRLNTRNQSILAHGFVSVSESVPSQLFAAALNLLPATETELLIIPFPE